jgi:hypothetical protein
MTDKITNSKATKKGLEKFNAILPEYFDDSVIEFRQGDLDALENDMALLQNLFRRVQFKIESLLSALINSNLEFDEMTKEQKHKYLTSLRRD